LISNLSSGVDSYTISTRTSGAQFHGSKSFVTPASLYAPLRVSVAKQGLYVVAGSEIGNVRIFDSRTGALAGELKHRQGMSRLVSYKCTDFFFVVAGGLVQEVAVSLVAFRHNTVLIT